MKIGVLGNNILAQDFKRMDYEVIDCDFRDFKIEFVLNYDVIINTHYYKPINNSPEEMILVKKCNVDLPFLLSEYCHSKKKKYVQFSTGQLYVQKDNPSNEESRICAGDAYSASKLLAECGCRKGDLIIRTKNIFNDMPTTENALFRAIINPTPTKNLENFTWTVDLIRAVTSLLRNKQNGVFNIASTGVTSQAEICKNLGIKNVAPILNSDFHNYIIMNIDKLNHHIIPSDTMENIDKCFKKIKDNLESYE